MLEARPGRDDRRAELDEHASSRACLSHERHPTLDSTRDRADSLASTTLSHHRIPEGIRE
jgi:hypothetical protein